VNFDNVTLPFYCILLFPIINTNVVVVQTYEMRVMLVPLTVDPETWYCDRPLNTICNICNFFIQSVREIGHVQCIFSLRCDGSDS